MKRWLATAPSNIALIKYMGKTDASKNRPTNGSISFTLRGLRSIVELESTAEGLDRWQPLVSYEGKKLETIVLSEKGAARFLAHLAKIKERFGYQGSFIVRSANDFPSDCGLASSASSFAALTMAALDAVSDLTGKPAPTAAEAAEISRTGSGSSCRSFFGPFAQWDSSGEVRAVPEVGFIDLLHQVVVVDETLKEVSSSKAHERVTTSALFKGRPERAEERLTSLKAALAKNDWRGAFEITWAEFWDMHALFETSVPSFGYMTAGSLEVLRTVRALSWDVHGDGPLVTMDAGPNVHLLYRNDEAGRAFARKIAGAFQDRHKVISSSADGGALQ